MVCEDMENFGYIWGSFCGGIWIVEIECEDLAIVVFVRHYVYCKLIVTAYFNLQNKPNSHKSTRKSTKQQKKISQ